MNLRELATLVRDEAERWARDVGYEAETLEQQCAVCSWAFVGAATEIGIEAALANGVYFADEYADPHFWVFAWEPGVRGTQLVDLTLTQYDPLAPRAAVFTFRDPEVKRYGLMAFGDDAWGGIRDVDEKDGDELEDRVLARLRAMRASAATPVEVSAP